MRAFVFWVIAIVLIVSIAIFAGKSAADKCKRKGIELGAEARYTNNICIVKGWGRVF